MRVLEVRNVQEALPNGLELLSRHGEERKSRNGPVMVYPGPVTTVYFRPMERVIFWPERDANPFFHLMEGLWMLAGRNDVAFLANYVKRMSEFSDDGKILHGAYGHRWLHHFLIVAREGEEEHRVGEINQIATIIRMLKHDPDDRRCVLQMWDASVDLGRGGKDVPCLSGETIVWSPEEDLPIRELADRFASGSLTRWPVYSVDVKTSELKIQWCTDVWKSGRKRTIRLIFDDGSDLVLTPDHRLYHKMRLPLAGTHYEISETEAGALRVGDRVWATSRWPSCKGYPQIKRRLDVNTRGSNLAPIHRLYHEFLHGPIPEGIDVHHKNDIKMDSHAHNLQPIEHGIHSHNHQLGDNNNMRNMTPEQHRRRAAKHSISLKENWKRRKAEQLASCDNHVVVGIEEAGEQEVYDFTVPSFSTALIGTGVVAHNCNTQAYFSRGSSGALDMTVCCRSNDMIWGAYGANAVHFSMLQEFVAAGIGCEVGFLWQISNNYHAYVKTMDPIIELAKFAADPFRQTRNCPYYARKVETFPMVSTPVEKWMQDLYMLLDEGVTLGLRDRFFRRVVIPMMQAHRAYRMVGDPDRYLKALEIVSQCRASDWRLAAEEWIRRRQERANR